MSFSKELDYNPVFDERPTNSIYRFWIALNDSPVGEFIGATKYLIIFSYVFSKRNKDVICTFVTTIL